MACYGMKERLVFIMNKLKALLIAAILLLGLSACSESAEETEDTADTVDTTQQETAEEDTDTAEPDTEKSVVERPEDVEVVTYTPLTIDEEATERFINGENPTYDAENGCLVFIVTDEIEYEADDGCSIGISGEDGAYTIGGTLVMEGYETLESINGYRGAAIKLDETLAAGKYWFVINFSTYTVSFEYTVK